MDTSNENAARAIMLKAIATCVKGAALTSELSIAIAIMLNYHVFIYLWRGEMHTIPDTIRELLLATGVLQFDEDRQLHFIGLTLAESQFFLDCSKMHSHNREPAEELLLSQLRRRHIQARMQHAILLYK